MAGAAIRAFEFAKALSSEYEVILFSLETPQMKGDGFEILSFAEVKRQGHFSSASLLITQRLTFPFAFLAIRYRLKIIIDAYVPSPLELMEHFRYEHESLSKEQESKIFSDITNLQLSFALADGILCASERQKALWTGFLVGEKLISAKVYEKDPTLHHFLVTVPFGISKDAPEKKSSGPREKFNLKKSDQIILWGGGVWNWFDPLTLIQAMAAIQQERDDIKLVFMGVVPPDPNLPKTRMAESALALAKELKCFNRSVFFNTDWVPYSERENYLAESAFAISTHFNTTETHFSFRTRMLDYLWAGLPIIATEGDIFADWIERHHLGIVVPYQNSKALKQAILDMATQEEKLKNYRNNIAVFRETFLWSNVCLSLKALIAQKLLEKNSKSPFKQGKILCAMMMAKIRERGIWACCQAFFKQIR